MAHLSAASFALFALFLPQAPQTGSAAKPGTAPSAPAGMTTYHNDALHLAYSYPKSFQSMGDAANQAISQATDNASGVTKAAMSCVTAPLAAIDASSGFKMVLLLRLDGACMGQVPAADGLAALVGSELRQSLAKFGAPALGTPAAYKVSTHDAEVVTGSVDSKAVGGTLYAAASCVIAGKDTVCWEFLSTACGELPELGKYTFSLEGSTPEPVVPEKLFPGCTS